MNGRVTLLLLLLLLAFPVWAKERGSPLLTQLEAEFKGKEFSTKVTLGSTTRHVYALYGGQETATHYIDTELYSNGRIQYLVRGIWQAGHGGFYVSLGEVDSKLAVGTRVRVTKLETKDDRIELWLAGQPGGEYAKLKLMLGKGFESSYDLDAVLGIISRALRLERFERLQFLKAEYPQLKAKLASAEAGFTSAQGAAARLAAARGLQEAVQALVKNRTDYDSLTQTLVDPEREQYTRQAADLGKTMQVLDQEAKKERAEEIRKILSSEVDEAGRIKAQLQRKAGSLAEWEQQMASLQRWEELLHRRQTLHGELAGLGQSPPTSEMDAVREGFQEVQTLRAGLEAQQQVLQLAELDSQYREMDRKSRQLWETYTGAADTPRQRPEGEKLYIHLHRMHENRTAAQNLGSNQAEGQAADLQKQMDRVQRQIGPVQVPRTLAELDNQYREMDRQRRQLMDAYTRAFGTPRQRPEGEKLYIHLHQMNENRTEAQHLGSEQAAGQAAGLQKEMDRLQRQIGPVQVPRSSSVMQTSPPSATASSRIRVGGNVMAGKLVFQPPPEYPPLASMARI